MSCRLVIYFQVISDDKVAEIAEDELIAFNDRKKGKIGQAGGDFLIGIMFHADIFNR